jgi:hypothetical protein
MDPITLVTSAVTLLSPYVAKGAEEFAKELGKDAAQKARDLYTYLKNKFSADSEESQILSLFEKKPEKYERNLTEVLQERAQNDSDFVDELQKHVDSAAPYIKVVQSLKGAKKAVGADVETVTTGTFDIQQDAEGSEETIGFRAKRVG